jgi:hypothetical protein
MLSEIMQHARQQKKNILILSTPRSGTHTLGYEFAHVDKNIKNLGEICMWDNSQYPPGEIEKLYKTEHLTVAQLVQYQSKLYLASEVSTIKRHVMVVCLRRKNKVKQFASLFYFTRVHQGSWLDLDPQKIQSEIGRHTATQYEIDGFLQQQMMDDFFLPDFNLVYDDLIFTQTSIRKNSFPFPIEQIFSNLDYVRQRLEHWTYSPEHLRGVIVREQV